MQTLHPDNATMEKFEEKMKAAGLSEAAIGAFRLNYEQLVAGVTGLVSGHPSATPIIFDACVSC